MEYLRVYCTEIAMTIGQDVTISGFVTYQRGYARQALYLKFNEIEGEYYYKYVFPNVEEWFDILLEENAFINWVPTGESQECDYCGGEGCEECGEEDGYVCESGIKYEKCYDTILDALIDILDGREIEIEITEDNVTDQILKDYADKGESTAAGATFYILNGDEYVIDKYGSVQTKENYLNED